MVGSFITAVVKTDCTLTLNEFLHSSAETLHTKRREGPLLAKEGTITKEFSYQSVIYVNYWVHLHAAKLGHGTDALLSLRRKACWRFLRPKNPAASAGFEPPNSGTRGQHANLWYPRLVAASLLPSFPTRTTPNQLAPVCKFCLRIFACKLYQTDLTGSALAADN